MSAADEVARLEAEAAQAASASAVAQAAAAEAVRDAEALKHEVTRDAAETIRERDAEISELKERVQWLANELTATKTETESLALALMGLVAMANPQEAPKESEPLTLPQAQSSVAVVVPEEAKTKDLPPKELPSESANNEPPVAPVKPQKRHRML